MSVVVVVVVLPFHLVLGMKTYEEPHRHNPLAYLQFTLELGFGFKSWIRAEQ